MLTIEALNKYGANTEEGLARCFGKEDFYLRLVATMPDDPHFQSLYDAIEKHEFETAFEVAHALKGATGNLSLTPLYIPLCALTDFLRTKSSMDYMPLVKEIMVQIDMLKALCTQ